MWVLLKLKLTPKGDFCVVSFPRGRFAQLQAIVDSFTSLTQDGSGVEK